MNVLPTALPGVLVIEPRVFGEARGWFTETWNNARYTSHGVSSTFVQDNVSYSIPSVLRGLHYQLPNGQGKLVSVLEGEVYDVAVDVRLDSPTFGKWVGVTLSSENHRQILGARGFRARLLRPQAVDRHLQGRRAVRPPLRARRSLE